MKNLTILKRVLASHALRPTEKIILAALLTAAPQDTVYSASLSELAKLTGLWKSTVCTNLAKLTERGYLKMNSTHQCHARREYHINQEAIAVPQEEQPPCKTKCTAREIYKFGTPMTETETTLSLAITSFNEILPELGELKNPTINGAKNFTALLERNPYLKKISWWEEYFKEIRNCYWLMGKNPKNWLPTFSFLINEPTILKIKAGGYRHKDTKPAHKESAEEYAERLYERLFGNPEMKKFQDKKGE